MRRRFAGGTARAALIALAVAGAAGGLCAGCGGGSGEVVRDAATGADADVDAGAGGDRDAPGDAVDCTASCDRIAAICEGVSNIDENWLSICRQNCEVRLAVQPDTARAEEACTSAAADCATAVLCSVSPLGRD
jgi:hypothetical protein